MADEGVPHTPAGEPWVSNAQFAIGERVYYFSSTHGAWLPAIVLGRTTRDRIVDTYNLDIRRGASASRLLPGPVARDAEPPECVASSSTSVAANQDHASDVQTEGPQAQTLAEPDQLVPNEAQDREEGEHHEEEVERRRQKFIAVKEGRINGIFENWETARKYVEGYSNAKCMAFRTVEECALWLERQK